MGALKFTRKEITKPEQSRIEKREQKTNTKEKYYIYIFMIKFNKTWLQVACW